MINQIAFGFRRITTTLTKKNGCVSQKIRFCTTTKARMNSLSTIFTCVPGKEFELTKEISKKINIPEEVVQIIKPGILEGPYVEHVPDLVFALQTLPSAQKFVDQSSVEIPTQFVNKNKPIIFHTLVPKMMKGNHKRTAVKHRCDNVMKNLIKHFSVKHPQTKFKKSTKLSWNKDGVFLCQLLNLDKGSFMISFSEPKQILHSHWPSLYIAGQQDIHMELPESPNSTFRKLQEAFWCMGKFPKPREFVADFGGAPGGFATLCLTYGAQVFSLDKAALEVQHKNLVSTKGDAFVFEPPFLFPNEEKTKVDWILWDVICEPQKFLVFLRKTCEEKRSKYIIGNVKFQGGTDWKALEEVQKIGEETGFDVRLKNLFNNKNEVCCMLIQKTRTKNWDEQ